MADFCECSRKFMNTPHVCIKKFIQISPIFLKDHDSKTIKKGQNFINIHEFHEDSSQES